MNMDWRRVPSLFSLRAFEAVARNGSLTAAAGELNVTHAAISQHLRKLEEEFATSLTRRSGRGIALTAQGQALATALSDGFGRIAQGIEALRAEQSAQPLVVTTTPSFAENWLMPRLGGFWSAHPEVELSLNPTVNTVDLAQDGVDLGIRYGRGYWPELNAEKLASAKFFAVATPDLIAREQLTQERLSEQVWFMEAMSSEHFRWAETQGFIGEGTRVERLETLALVMAAVRAGHGVTAASQAIVERDLETGALVALAEEESDTLGYFIVTPTRGVRPQAQVFIDWLKGQNG